MIPWTIYWHLHQIEEGSEYLDDFIEDFEDGVDSGLVVLEDGLEGAGDIISPSKTIQGSANFVIDKLTDLVNGTDDAGGRLDGGKYGGVLKITDETTELIADAVYNPEEFSNDFENVVTSDDFYDGMYQTNQDLWKPKEGSWFIKRAGCYAGEKTFEGLLGYLIFEPVLSQPITWKIRIIGLDTKALDLLNELVSFSDFTPSAEFRDEMEKHMNIN